MRDVWYAKPGVVYWYDQYVPDYYSEGFSEYDPERVLRELLMVDADVYVIYARNQWGVNYYNSKIEGKHPGLGDHDYLGELTEGLKAKGKKVVAYVNWLDSKHPEWRVKPLGRDDLKVPKKVLGGQWYVHCVNSPKRDLIKLIIQEIIEKYPIDGLHLDMFFHPGVCVCKYCRAQFSSIFSKEDITWMDVKEKWNEYIDWKKKTSTEFLRQLKQILAKRGIPAFHNAFVPIFFPPLYGPNLGWMPYIDAHISEAWLRLDQQTADINSTSIIVKLHRALNKPSWLLVTQDNPRLWHNPIAREEFLVHAASCAANGGGIFGPCGVGAYPDSRTSIRGLETVAEVFRYYKKLQEYMKDVEPVKHVAIAYSFNTRDYYEREDPKRYRYEFLGICRAFMESHIPFDLVVPELVQDNSALRDYDLVVLPNIACTSREFDSIIFNYVENGGNLLATYETSLYKEKGERKEDYSLANVLGVNFMGNYEYPSFYCEWPIEPTICVGKGLIFKAQGEVMNRLVAPSFPDGVVDRFISPPGQITQYPLITRNAFGNGQAFYVGFNIGGFYYEFGYYQTGELLERLLEKVLPKRIIKTNAPKTVELAILRQSRRKRRLIHLVNKTTNHPYPGRTLTRSINTIIPVNDITLDVPLDEQDVNAWALNSKIHTEIQGNFLHVTVPKLKIHEIVVIEEKN